MTAWTAREAETARKAYLRGGSNEVLRILPHRTPYAVWSAAERNGWRAGPVLNAGTRGHRIACMLAALGPMTTAQVAGRLGISVKLASPYMTDLVSRGFAEAAETEHGRWKLIYSLKPEHAERFA